MTQAAFHRLVIGKAGRSGACEGMIAGFCTRIAALLLLSLGLIGPGHALESAPVTSPRVTATVLSSRDAVTPGERFHVALVQQIAPGWHTYWRNPGDSGEATRIEWTLPAGVTADAIEWPAPKAMPFGPLVNYGFKDTVLLPVEITVPGDAKPGETITLSARTSWLVCETICVPEDGNFSLALPVRSEAVIDEAAQQRIEQTRFSLPRPASFAATLGAEGQSGLRLDLPGFAAAATDLRFFPYPDSLIENAGEQKVDSRPDGKSLRLERAQAFRLADAKVEGVLTYRQAGVPRALILTAEPDPELTKLAAAAKPPAVIPVTPLPAAGSDLSFWTALMFAFAGGLILNLMPCVLPVLFIKALGFAQLARASRRETTEQGLLFMAGVLATFALLAGIIIGFGALGSGLGWGYQLQSPPIVIGLAAVMLLIGLNLLGAFEIGTSAAGLGQGLAGRGGRLGAFMTGALAVVVATPCTAPFMGAAMGFALTQAPATALAVFMALALGFALPVTALSLAPGLLRLLPKPGRWMLILKQAFAFPMFATAIWLVWVASVQTGPAGVLTALVALLAAGFVVWLVRVTREGRGRPIGLAAALLILSGTGWFVMENAVPVPAATTASSGEAEPWSPQRVAELQAQGKPVFVNFTAAWCITCLANERVALARAEVKRGFADLGIAYLKADWTNRNPEIAKALAEHGRAGVPLYLFYPGKPGAAPEVLPQILTPSDVIAATSRAAGREVARR